MHKIKIIIIILVSIKITCFAQLNMVKNGSFELFEKKKKLKKIKKKKKTSRIPGNIMEKMILSHGKRMK